MAHLPSLASFGNDERGAISALMAIGMTAIVGFVGLGIDVSNWYMQRRLTQNMADAAAVAGTYAALRGDELSAIRAAAAQDAYRNGFVADAGASLDVAAVPPPSAPSPVTPLVTVTISREVPVYFARLVMGARATTITARAVGGTRGLGPLCVIALDPTANRAMLFNGNTEARIGCGVAVNSAASDALYVGGSAILEANPAQAVGDIQIAGAAQLISNYPPLPHSPAVPDPFAGRSFPAKPASVDKNGGLSVKKNDGPVNLAPSSPNGAYRIKGDVTVHGQLNLAPGTYYIDGGSLTINAQAKVNGNGATIVLTGDNAAAVGTVRINGGAEVNLKAPAGGPFQGIVFYQDRIAGTSGDNRFNGGATMRLQGVVYFPRQPVQFNGGADIPGCTQIVARTVAFTGNSYIRNTEALCTDIGLAPSDQPAQEQVVLVE